MNARLKELYKTIILEHNKTPFFYKKNEEATFVLKAYNQICGDRFELYFEVKNGVIEDLTFHGFGCAISKASTSVLVKNLKGKDFVKALLFCRQFLSATTSEEESNEQLGEEVEAFSAAKEFPGRLKCATLAWDEMVEFLENGGQLKVDG
ncbi:MAG: Fe-S cluster assembly sulfur transfer protein SufU [Saprospiraceae bacterium]